MAKKQQDLPGMADRKLADLQDAAVEYADLRDNRLKWGNRESDKKKELIVLMKKHKKEHYECEGVVIDLVMEKENVKVSIRGSEDEE